MRTGLNRKLNPISGQATLGIHPCCCSHGTIGPSDNAHGMDLVKQHVCSYWSSMRMQTDKGEN